MLNYPIHVLQAVHQWFIHNENEYYSYNTIRKMSRTLILEIYLEWEGIYGYTDTILDIFKCEGYEEND